VSLFREVGWLVTASLSVEVSRDYWKRNAVRTLWWVIPIQFQQTVLLRIHVGKITHEESTTLIHKWNVSLELAETCYIVWRLQIQRWICQVMSFSASRNAQLRILMYMRMYMGSIPMAYKFYYISYTWKEWTAVKFLYWIWTWTCNISRVHFIPLFS